MNVLPETTRRKTMTKKNKITKTYEEQKKRGNKLVKGRI